MEIFINRDGNKIRIFSKRLFLVKQVDKFIIKHKFCHIDGKLILSNIKFHINIAPRSRAKIFIQIWLPFIHIINDNSALKIGNRYQLIWWH